MTTSVTTVGTALELDEARAPAARATTEAAVKRILNEISKIKSNQICMYKVEDL